MRSRGEYHCHTVGSRHQILIIFYEDPIPTDFTTIYIPSKNGLIVISRSQLRDNSFAIAINEMIIHVQWYLVSLLQEYSHYCI